MRSLHAPLIVLMEGYSGNTSANHVIDPFRSRVPSAAFDKFVTSFSLHLSAHLHRHER